MTLIELCEGRTRAKMIRATKKAKAKTMNPKVSNDEQIPFSGQYPSDVEASMGSTTHGSRYQASLSSVN